MAKLTLSEKTLGVHFKRVETLCALLRQTDLQAYLVGGVVRDLLLNLTLGKDLDITFEGSSLPVLVRAFAEKSQAQVRAHPEFLTYAIHFSDGSAWDFITARREIYPVPGALPEVEAADLKADLARRDFTINAMAVPLKLDQNLDIIDPFSGQSDLAQKHLRTLHKNSFWEDPTRLLRAVRFLARFSLDPATETAQEIQQAWGEKVLETITRERIWIEIEKNFAEPAVSPQLEWIQRWDASTQVWGDLPQCCGRAHFFRKLDEKLNFPQEKKILLRAAALLHGVENAALESTAHFLRLPKESRKIAQELNQIWHAFKSDCPVFELPEKTSPDAHLLLQVCSEIHPPFLAYYERLKQWELAEPLLSGDDFVAMGYAPGPHFKAMLQALRRARAENRIKTRSEEENFIIDNFRR